MLSLDTTADVRSLIAQTIERLANGTCNANEANSIARLLSVQMSTAKLDLDTRKFVARLTTKEQEAIPAPTKFNTDKDSGAPKTN